MARKIFTVEQIFTTLRTVEALCAQGMSVKEATKQEGITEITYLSWRGEFDGMSAVAVKRLKHLEKENRRLKKRVVELSLETQKLTHLKSYATFISERLEDTESRLTNFVGFLCHKFSVEEVSIDELREYANTQRPVFKYFGSGDHVESVLVVQKEAKVCADRFDEPAGNNADVGAGENPGVAEC